MLICDDLKKSSDSVTNELRVDDFWSNEGEESSAGIMGLKSTSILEDCYLFPDTGNCK